jgi:hypothetical protein
VPCIDDTEIDVVLPVETERTVVGCRQCAVVAKSKDRRWVTLHDAPSAGRPVTVQWCERVWSRPEPAYAVKT